MKRKRPSSSVRATFFRTIEVDGPNGLVSGTVLAGLGEYASQTEDQHQRAIHFVRITGTLKTNYIINTISMKTSIKRNRVIRNKQRSRMKGVNPHRRPKNGVATSKPNSGWKSNFRMSGSNLFGFCAVIGS
jgi:hypothetical protein